MAAHIPESVDFAGEYNGVRFDFALDADKRRGQPFDLDNLCEPVFRVLVSDRGYFGGRRPNVKWWRATKLVGKPPGCTINLGVRPETDKLVGRVMFESVYRGEFPKSASDTGIADWLEANTTNAAKIVTVRRTACHLMAASGCPGS